MIVIIVTAFSLTQKKLAEMMYTDEINQHEKDVKTLIVQYDSLKMITFESIKLTYMYDSISNDAIDSAVNQNVSSNGRTTQPTKIENEKNDI